MVIKTQGEPPRALQIRKEETEKHGHPMLRNTASGSGPEIGLPGRMSAGF